MAGGMGRPDAAPGPGAEGADRALEDAAEALGIQPRYEGMGGTISHPPRRTLERLIDAFGPGAVQEADLSLAAPKGVRCHLPPGPRVWGVAVQLYQLRTPRNWGIGDFADLEMLAAELGPSGADFIGLNPLHAPFLADPAQCSPFRPSDRRFLNPLYIAVDRVAGFAPDLMDDAALSALRGEPLVDYAGVAAEKSRVLQAIWQRQGRPGPTGAFRARSGLALDRFCLFEALSAEMVRRGFDAGWQDWPHALHDPSSPEVRDFASTHAPDIAFHGWLQEEADRQLSNAADACRAAGMSIGLYLDYAVGEDPGGAGSWGRDDVLASARIGAPPDPFSAIGQDWGLAPLSPIAMSRDGAATFRAMMRAATRRAGALRLDHAMCLWQLFLIPEGGRAAEGTYVRFPMQDMLRALADASHESGTIIIGEDLGNVPSGFREVMRASGILSYRILFFEQDARGFIPPSAYPPNALACLSTHDMPTFRGWWRGTDIGLRHEAGLIGPDENAAQQVRRTEERDLLLRDLGAAGHKVDADDPASVVVALHRHLAAAPSRMFAVRLEDLAAEDDPVNVPGTSNEYPNWRRKLRVDLDTVIASPLFGRIVAAVRAERPRG